MSQVLPISLVRDVYIFTVGETEAEASGECLGIFFWDAYKCFFLRERLIYDEASPPKMVSTLIVDDLTQYCYIKRSIAPVQRGLPIPLLTEAVSSTSFRYFFSLKRQFKLCCETLKLNLEIFSSLFSSFF